MTELPSDFDPNSDDYIREVIEHEPASTERSLSRRMALQALYEIDSARHPEGLVIAALLEARPVSNKIANYMRRLVEGVIQNRVQLDTLIQGYALEWPLDQVAIIDRNILRLAVYELATRPQLAVGVGIDEAVELAKLFGSDSTPRFVNGVLGAMLNNVNDVRELFAAEQTNEDDEDGSS